MHPKCFEIEIIIIIIIIIITYLTRVNPSSEAVIYGVPWGPFLESPGNFTGPKSNIQIEIKRIRGWVLASKILSFVSLTDSFVMLDAKLLKHLSCL